MNRGTVMMKHGKSESAPWTLLALTMALIGCGTSEATEDTGSEPLQETEPVVAVEPEAVVDEQEPVTEIEDEPATTGEDAQSKDSARQVTEPPVVPTTAEDLPSGREELIESAPDEPVAEVEQELVVPAGRSLVFELLSTLSTRSNVVGDQFGVKLLNDVIDETGTPVLEAGSPAVGVVTAAERSAGSGEPAVLTVGLDHLRIDGIEIVLDGEIVEAEVQGREADSGRKTAAKIAGGAAAGALLGKILGGDGKDALKGAVAGAVAGTVFALETKDGHAELPAGTFLTFRVSEPIVIR